MIVPLSPSGVADADVWAEMYDAEPAWLDWALSKMSLPPEPDVLGWDTPKALSAS